MQTRPAPLTPASLFAAALLLAAPLFAQSTPAPGTSVPADEATILLSPFEVRTDGDGSLVEQTAFFEPHGLPGYAYWYSVLPFHRFVFPGLIDALKRTAEASESQSTHPPATGKTSS